MALPHAYEPRVQLSIADDTVQPGRLLRGEFSLTNWAQPWDDAFDLPQNSTFQSLLLNEQLRNLTTPALVPSQQQWYDETIRNGGRKTWTSPFVAYDGQQLLGAGQGIVLPSSSQPVGVCIAQVSASELDKAILFTRTSARTHYIVVRSTGRMLATSLPSLRTLVATTSNVAGWIQNATNTSSGAAFLNEVLPALYEASILSRVPAQTPPSSGQQAAVIVRLTAHIEGRLHLCRAGVLSTLGFSGVMVTCFDHSDFDDGSARLLDRIVLSTLLVLLIAFLVNIVAVRMVWSGMTEIITFMTALHRAFSGVEDEKGRNSLIRRAARRWDSRFGLVPVAPSGDKGTSEQRSADMLSKQLGDAPVGIASPQPDDLSFPGIDMDPFDAGTSFDVAPSMAPEGSELSGLGNTHQGDSGPSDLAASDPPLSERPFRCQLYEPALMRSVMGDLLRSLCKYQDQVELEIEARHHFIRYIFHEVRVPFNSVVLCKLQNLFAVELFLCIHQVDLKCRR